MSNWIIFFWKTYFLFIPLMSPSCSASWTDAFTFCWIYMKTSRQRANTVSKSEASLTPGNPVLRWFTECTHGQIALTWIAAAQLAMQLTEWGPIRWLSPGETGAKPGKKNNKTTKNTLVISFMSSDLNLLCSVGAPSQAESSTWFNTHWVNIIGYYKQQSIFSTCPSLPNFGSKHFMQTLLIVRIVLETSVTYLHKLPWIKVFCQIQCKYIVDNYSILQNI